MSYTVQGYTIETIKTLASIGNASFLLDYRKGVDVASNGISVLSWKDQGGNGIIFRKSSVSNALRLYTDSVGGIGSGGGAEFLQATFNPAFNVLHNGTPILFFMVAHSANWATGTSFFHPSTRRGWSGAGVEFEILSTTNLRHLLYSSAGTNLGGQNIAGALSGKSGRDILIMKQYNGPNTGTNNLKFWVENTLYQYTWNPAFSQTNTSQMVIGSQNSNLMTYRIKTMGVFNLAGKTIAEIDAFRILFLQTLKSDPPYSSLTTP